VTRLRDKRESQALKFLIKRGRASAVDLGAAAVSGEPHQRRNSDAIGMKIGLHLVKRGIAQVDKFNVFAWVSK